jgi:hypothetical protein
VQQPVPVRRTSGAAVLVVGMAIAACAYEPVPPPEHQLSSYLEAPQPSAPPHDLTYTGDHARFAQRSGAARHLSPSGRSALIRLANATTFTSSEVFLGGNLSPHARDFRALLDEGSAVAAFSELAHSAQPEAALYGLAGLYLLDRSQYRDRAQALRASTVTVSTLVGCIGGNRTLASVIGGDRTNELQLEDGSWPKNLAGQQ